MSKLARATLTLLLPLTSVALVAVIFEIGLRLTGHVAIYEMYSKPSMFWRYDELLGWSHEPGARGEFVGPRPWPIEFRGKVAINSLGLRGPEIPVREPAERRILFLGDSMVAAFEVDYEQTYIALLADLLRDRLNAGVRTINAGVRGYGTDQSYLYYRERGWRLEPALVVFLHSGNDPPDNMTLHEMRRPFGKPAFSLTPAGTLDLVGAPVPHYPSCSEVELSREYRPRRIDTVFGRTLCAAQMVLFDHSALFSYLTLALPWDTVFLKNLYYMGNPHAGQLERSSDRNGAASFEGRITTAILLALADEAHRHGAAFLVMTQTGHIEQLDLEALGQRGIRVVNFSPIESDGANLRWHHDSHFNPEGHRRIAEFIAPELEALMKAHTATADAASP